MWVFFCCWIFTLHFRWYLSPDFEHFFINDSVFSNKCMITNRNVSAKTTGELWIVKIGEKVNAHAKGDVSRFGILVVFLDFLQVPWKYRRPRKLDLFLNGQLNVSSLIETKREHGNNYWNKSQNFILNPKLPDTLSIWPMSQI